MTLISPDDIIACRPPQPPQQSPLTPLVCVDGDSPDVPIIPETTQASVLFLLTLLELAPPHLQGYIDPPQPLTPGLITNGTHSDLERLLFLCKDVLAFLCPQVLDTDAWDRLVHQVLLQRDTDQDSEVDQDVPIYQDQWEKQWEHSFEEDITIENAAEFIPELRGRQGAYRSWEAYRELKNGDALWDEFDDVVKDGEGGPAAASDPFGCMELVSRASEMLVEWVQENGEPVSRSACCPLHESDESLPLLRPFIAPSLAWKSATVRPRRIT